MKAPPKKYTRGETDKIFPHKHCSRCSKMVPEFGDGYCSNECRHFGKRKEKGDKRKLIKTIGTIGATAGALIILFVVMSGMQ